MLIFNILDLFHNFCIQNKSMKQINVFEDLLQNGIDET